MKDLFKKIIVIIKINILVLASYTSSAQATTTFVREEGLQNNNPDSVTFNNDGTRMFIISDDNLSIDTYVLTTGFDITTKAFNAALSFDLIALPNLAPRGLAFNNDGSVMIVSNANTDSIETYNLAVNFNPSTAGFAGVLDTSGEVGTEGDVAFNNDGSKVYIIERDNPHDINEYSLNLNFDLTTWDGVAPRAFSFATEVGATVLSKSFAFVFNDDGSKMFMAGIDGGGDRFVWEYALETAFDALTAVFTDNFDISNQVTTPSGINFNNDGTKMFIVDFTEDKIVEYSLDNGFDIVPPADEEEADEEEAGLANPVTDKDVIGSINTQSNISKNIISQSIGPISSRLSNLRRNRDSNNLSENNIKLDFNNAILTSLTEELLAKNDKSIIPDNWSSWSEGTISVSKIGDRINSSSSKTDGQNLALGFDTKLNNNDLLGFAVQYGQSDTDIGSNGTNVDSENINLSIYRTRPLDDDNFIEGMFGVGLIESDLKRVSGANTLTGSRNGTQIFGSINYGKTLDKGDFNLTPIARVDLGYTELDAYSETGTDALTYAKQTIESGLASVGLEFSDIVKFNDNKFKPFGSIEYGMDFSNSSDAKMNYVSDTSTIYTYTQGSNSNHLITSVVGFEYITKDNLEIISSYKRIQGNESEQTDILNVSVNFKSKRETEYAMSLDGSEDLKAGFDISKNINGFDLNFNANQSLSENSNRVAEVSMSRKF